MLFITLIIAALPDNDNTNGVRSRRCVEGAKPQPHPLLSHPFACGYLQTRLSALFVSDD